MQASTETDESSGERVEALAASGELPENSTGSPPENQLVKRIESGAHSSA
jgi:hypothetical protein